MPCNRIQPKQLPGDCVLIGFSSDEGVRRNKGRRGAADGPDALRAGLASMALAEPLQIQDAGTVAVSGEELEGRSSRTRERPSALRLIRDTSPWFSGEDTKSPTARISASRAPSWRTAGAKLGILNLDAHFDLRGDPIPSSGTPFRQIAEDETAAGTSHQYSVIGISQPSNTTALFDTAHRLGVRYLLDEECGGDRPRRRGSVPRRLPRRRRPGLPDHRPRRPASSCGAGRQLTCGLRSQPRNHPIRM